MRTYIVTGDGARHQCHLETIIIRLDCSYFEEKKMWLQPLQALFVLSTLDVNGRTRTSVARVICHTCWHITVHGT